MLDNAKNNAIGMRELQSLLAKCEMAFGQLGLDFDRLKHHVQCYTHIINICASHIISSMTSVSKQYISNLKVPTDTDSMFCAKDNDDLDDDNSDTKDIAELQPDGCYNAHGDADLEEWFAGIKHDPLRCAHRVIHFLHSSDQHKQSFHGFIHSRNERDWFTKINADGKHVLVKLSDVQLLRDVKTRWDLVYMMLERLRYLRPVSSSQRLDSAWWRLIKT
jgi:hypothetical protein